MLEKAASLAVDEVFLDLEDAVAPAAKDSARENVVKALHEVDYGSRTVAVRINDATTKWAYQDVVDVVSRAGDQLDCVMLPKASNAGHVSWLDLLLGQLELACGLPVGRIGIEAQIEDAQGLVHVDEIAAASPRLETLIYGPADFAASLHRPTLTVGELADDYPGDASHYILMRILVAARAYGLQAIDGPYGAIHDVAGYARSAARAAALGYDGKWVLHPGQVQAANDSFTPSTEQYDRAELILDAYQHYTSAEGGALGAVMLGDEMIDEASRKMALSVAARGRAAGLPRSTRFEPSAPGR
jgi:citrate lyase subunit beta/citryl-CoA lyase